MPDIIVPRAGTSPGRAARAQGVASVAPVPPSALGAAAAEFGEAVAAFGEKLEQDRSDRELARFRIDATRRLGEIRNEYETTEDPDRIATEFPAMRDAARAELTDGLSARVRERAETIWDGIAVGHEIGLGRREMGLRQAARIKIAGEHRAAAVNAYVVAPNAEARAASLAAYAGTLDDMVAFGTIGTAERDEELRVAAADAQGALALRRLTDDPAGLAEAIDGPEFAAIKPDARARIRDRAIARVRSEEARAAAEADRARSEADRAADARLGEIGKIADAGRHSVDEAWLETPEAKARPGYAEAAAAVQLRDDMPEFATLPPAKMRELVEAERDRPVGASFETDRLKAMERVLKAQEAAWADDPIKEAGRLKEDSVPPAPDFAAADDQALATFFARRAQFGGSLVDQGYIKRPAFFRKEERAQLAAATAIDQPPERRARVAALIASSMAREDAVQAIAEIGADPVFTLAGMTVASGGSLQTAEDIFRGQDELKNKTVSLPPQKDRDAVAAGVFAGLDIATYPAAFRGAAIEAANALYARDLASQNIGGGISDYWSDENAAAYQKALQRALGATYDGGTLVLGGAQKVNGETVILPPDVSPQMILGGFDEAISRVQPFDLVRKQSGLQTTVERRGRAPDEGLWRRHSHFGGAPVWQGAPLSEGHTKQLRLRPLGGGLYGLTMQFNGEPRDVMDSDAGSIFVLRLSDFAREAVR